MMSSSTSTSSKTKTQYFSERSWIRSNPSVILHGKGLRTGSFDYISITFHTRKPIHKCTQEIHKCMREIHTNTQQSCIIVLIVTLLCSQSTNALSVPVNSCTANHVTLRLLVRGLDSLMHTSLCPHYLKDAIWCLPPEGANRPLSWIFLGLDSFRFLTFETTEV